MLKTKRLFTENIVHFYVDDEVTSFLSNQKALTGIYARMNEVDGLAVVYPLVIPKNAKELIFDLMVIIKHEKATEQGQWELYIADNFINQKTNLSQLFSYIETTTKSDIKLLLKSIQQELKEYREQNNLDGKTFVEIDGDKKIIAFGYVEN